MSEELENPLWWQTGIIYQIYPRSFQDSNADGVGDLPGITQRLDYLKWLGVQAVWISPIYPSPMADFGYDVSDYCGIHPLFGSMADFDALLRELHRREMKLILDLVPNHSSDEHPWFRESRSSRSNPKRNWYLWQDAAADGSPPNNWLSVFGGSAWEWDEATQQYYYHAYHVKQPDLNWRNPEVQEAMLDVMRFWLDKGVDGFRVDVMWHMIKDRQWRDNPPNPQYVPGELPYRQLMPLYSTDQPEVHEIVRRMRQLLDGYSERMMIGEIYLPIEKLMAYYGVNQQGAHLPFNFQLLERPWDPQQLFLMIKEYEGALPAGGWPNWVLSNHDKVRIASRVGVDQARIAAMLLLTLRGTPTIYYGDELGLRDVAIPPEEVRDPQGLNMPDKFLSRDPARTPMLWDLSAEAGFSSVQPWLRLGPDHQQLNVSVQQKQADSMLLFYKRLIGLRQQSPALQLGAYRGIHADRQLLMYVREMGDEAYLIALNLSHRPAYYKPEAGQYQGTIVLSTNAGREGSLLADTLLLEGDEGIIVRLAQG